VIFRFIQAEKANHHVRTLCRLLGVSSSGYYAFCSRPPSRRALQDLELTEQILTIHQASRRNYGAPRIHAALQFEGRRCAKKRVARLMKRACIQGVPTRRRYCTTRRAASQPIAPDLLGRNFTAAAPNRVWVADITYVATVEGFLHLSAIEDLFSRAVVGWSMAPHLRTELVADALAMATTRRRPQAGLIHHSDQGCQYTSLEFGRRLKESGILPSMGAVGTAYDNAVAESFFATLKRELVAKHRWPTRAAARAAIFEYIECFYNRTRLHSTNGMLSPEQLERRYGEGNQEASVA
jgi:putative transposase